MRAWCCMLLLFVSAAHADESLQERLQSIQSLRGEFSQRVLSESGQVLESSSGRFKLLHPGYLSWHILDPDEQLLLASGDSLLHYDVELETATRRRIGQGPSRGPLAILSGDRAELEAQYQIESTGEDSYRLVPLAAGGDITELSLTFSGPVPVTMTATDQLRQMTVIDFSSVQLNPALSAADFDFSLPDGVDLYDNER